MPMICQKMKNYLINPVETREAALEKPEALLDAVEEPEAVFQLEGFMSASEADLEILRQQYGLAMDLGDLRFMQGYFRDEEKRNPTITELKMIDTYWSDHCRSYDLYDTDYRYYFRRSTGERKL